MGAAAALVKQQTVVLTITYDERAYPPPSEWDFATLLDVRPSDVVVGQPQLRMVLVDPDVMFFLRTDDEQHHVAMEATRLDAGILTFEWDGTYDSYESAVDTIAEMYHTQVEREP